MESRGKAPGQGSEGLRPPEADDILFLETNFLTKLSHKLGKFRLHGERQSVSYAKIGGGAQSHFSHTFTVGLGRLPLHVTWRRQDIE